MEVITMESGAFQHLLNQQAEMIETAVQKATQKVIDSFQKPELDLDEAKTLLGVCTSTLDKLRSNPANGIEWRWKNKAGKGGQLLFNTASLIQYRDRKSSGTLLTRKRKE